MPVDMKLKDEQDQDIVLGDLGSDIEDLKGVVIFCVPKADTRAFTSSMASNSLIVLTCSGMHNSSMWLQRQLSRLF